LANTSGAYSKKWRLFKGGRGGGLIQGFTGCMRFPVAHVILYIQNSLNKTNVKMSMKWLELDNNIVERFGLYFLALLYSTFCYTLKLRLKSFFLTFVSPTLSPSGEIIARMSLVFVSAALLAEVAVTKQTSFRLLCFNRENYTTASMVKIEMCTHVLQSLILVN